MTGFPPALDATQGFRAVRRQVADVLYAAAAGARLIQREPGAFVIWMALWLATVTLSALLVAFGGAVPTDPGVYHNLGARFGPFAVVLIATFLICWAVTTQAVFRAMLQPDERRFAYLRLGSDELRLAVMSLVAFVLILVLGGVPAFLLLALASPFMQAAPDLIKYIAVIGAIATIGVDVWVGVRLSLIAVETFAEGRFHLTAYWPLTRGRFWYLTFIYGVCFLLFLGIGAIVGGATAGLETAQVIIGQPHGADVFRRGALLAMAGLYALIFSASWVATTALFCAAQAHAFRAITGVHKRRMPGF
jgi:hypothetical protein